MGRLIKRSTLRVGKPRQGAGRDGSTPPAQDTAAGHGGSGPQKPPALRGIANTATAAKRHRLRDLSRWLEAAVLFHCWHALNKEAASGVDGGTAETDAVTRHGNITALAQRLKTKRSRAKLVRRCDIPTEHGPERPGGRPALEDKRVPLACAKLLTAI